jgi:hypothetical protein
MWFHGGLYAWDVAIIHNFITKSMPSVSLKMNGIEVSGVFVFLFPRMLLNVIMGVVSETKIDM